MNRFIDVPQTVSLINQERTNNRLYVRWCKPSPTAYYDDKTMPSLPASVSERNAGGPRLQPRDGDHAGNGVGTDRDAVRLHGDRQLLPENSREVSRKPVNETMI